MRAKYGIPYSAFVILAVGQFIYRKGFDVLLNCLPLISGDVFSLFVGGDATEEYKQIVEANRLANVRFAPFQSRDQVFEYYSLADVLVAPTREDIWGLVVNEAMACGLPVISTDKCIAALELIRQPETGYVVSVNDTWALAEAISKMRRVSGNSPNISSVEVIKDSTMERMVLSHIDIFLRGGK